jgi:hypothetical protein
MFQACYGDFAAKLSALTPKVSSVIETNLQMPSSSSMISALGEVGPGRSHCSCLRFALVSIAVFDNVSGHLVGCGLCGSEWARHGRAAGHRA